MTARLTLMAMASMVACSQACASEWVVGLSYADFSRDDSRNTATLTLELRATPLWAIGNTDIGLAGAVMVDHVGNLWAGVGVSAVTPIAQRWFVETSVMPGFYDEGVRDNDLGDAFEIRSLIGVGYALNADFRVSIASDHRSNAGVGDRNPGVNSFGLRLSSAF